METVQYTPISFFYIRIVFQTVRSDDNKFLPRFYTSLVILASFP